MDAQDGLSDAAAEFAALVEKVRPFESLPCVCDNSSVKAKEESLAHCTPCHINGLFDETLDHARGVVDYMEDMAANHPKRAPLQRRKRPKERYQPLSRKPQPNALWLVK